jgi:hypothetical protein
VVVAVAVSGSDAVIAIKVAVFAVLVLSVFLWAVLAWRERRRL